ncbi:Fe(3+) dicitrate ABC transporter substrate-binding protein [Bacillus spongiae]|uniref:Fe(3+) dicitrate ABC transporter substrate-binding protein n=1 Tax=Bacillus spongiae TaxID=2683610 RepID=A0ABU8H9B2_9BACI
MLGRQYIVSLLSIFLISILILAGCGAQSTQEGKTAEEKENTEKIMIQHELGETEISGKPEKVVVLEYSFVDALASLGVTPVGIADDGKKENIITSISDQIEEYTSVGTRKQPNLEVIHSLKPDLIIADLKRHKGIYEDLQAISPTIVLPSLDGNYEDNIEAFPVIAKALGMSDEAEVRLKDHHNQIEELRAMIPSDEGRSVLPAVVTSNGFFGHSDKSYVGSLFTDLGFTHAITEEDAKGLQEYLDSPYLKMNLEQLVEFNPDILFLMKSEDNTIEEEWEENPLWENISAVKNNQVYEVDRNTWAKFRGLISSELIGKDAVNHLYEGITVE